MTDHKTSTRAAKNFHLWRSSPIFEAVFESSAYAMLIVDSESGDVLALNRTTEKLFPQDEFRILSSQETAQVHQQEYVSLGESNNISNAEKKSPEPGSFANSSSSLTRFQATKSTQVFLEFSGWQQAIVFEKQHATLVVIKEITRLESFNSTPGIPTTSASPTHDSLLENIIEQLPEAVAVVEAKTHKIVLSNSRFSKLLEPLADKSISASESNSWPFKNDQAMRQNLDEDSISPHHHKVLTSAAFNLQDICGLALNGAEYSSKDWPWMKVFETATRIDDEPVELVRPDGSHIFVEISASPLFDETQRVQAAIVTMRDATLRQVSELARRQASAIARENLDRFRSIFEQTSVGMAQAQLDGQFLIVNPGICTMLGYDAEELSRLTVEKITHPFDIELDRKCRESILTGNENVESLEKRFLHKDGSTLWVSSMLSLTRNAAGEILSILEIVQDISARKRAEGALQESEELFRLACGAAQLGAFDHDLATGTLNTSPQAERLFGFDDGSPHPSRRDWLLRVHPDDVEAATATTQQAIEENRDVYVEYRVVWPDGSTRWMASIAHPIWENGQPLRNVGIIQDITARKEAELGLRLREARFRSLATASAAIIIITAGNGSVIEEMQGWRDYTGQDFEASRGSGWLQMVHPDDRDDAIEKWREGVRQRRLIENDFRLWHAASQEYRFVTARGVPVYNERDQLQEWVGTISDVHERRSAEAELEHSRLLFQRIAKALPGILYLFDLPSRTTIYVNEGVDSILGYTPQQIKDMGQKLLHEIIHPDDLPEVAQEFARFDVLPEGAVIEHEYRARQANGRYLWLRAHDVVFDRDAVGGVQQILGFALDISAQHRFAQELAQGAEELQRAEERYRTFLHQSTEGIWRVEMRQPVSTTLPASEQIEGFYENGYLAECNDAMAHMYGFENGAELVGVDLKDLLPADDRHNQEYLRQVIANDYRISDAESVELDRDGNSKHFLNNLVGIIEDGKLVRAWGLQRDVTRQREIETALQQSEEHLRLAVDAAQIGVWMWDITADKSHWNNHHFNLLGLEPDSGVEASYRTVEKALHPDDRAPLRQALNKALESNGVLETECRVIWPNGSTHWLAVRGEVFEWQPEKAGQPRRPLRMSGVIYDTTARKEVEESLKRAPRGFAPPA